MNHYLRLGIGVVLFGLVGLIASILFLNQWSTIDRANLPIVIEKIVFILITTVAGFGLRKVGRGY